MKKFMLIATISFGSISAFGWGDLGHETTAEIAEQVLISSSPQTRKKIQDIIGVEPFAMAATWPDHVRSEEKFKDFAGYHFLTFFEDPKQHNEKDALIVLKKYRNLVTSKELPREVKMIALRYIIHVLGDIHQPLHVGNEFDHGGNFCTVNWKPNTNGEGKTTNLHSAWDSNLVDFAMYRMKDTQNSPAKYYGYKDFAAGLIATHETQMRSRQIVDVDAWTKESNEFLHSGDVYPDKLPADKRPYCQKNGEAKVLDQDYIKKAAAIVEDRIVLGGVRTAAFLKEMFADLPSNGPTEDEVLNRLNIKN